MYDENSHDDGDGDGDDDDDRDDYGNTYDDKKNDNDSVE
jgi:hypothetical protein